MLCTSIVCVNRRKLQIGNDTISETCMSTSILSGVEHHETECLDKKIRNRLYVTSVASIRLRSFWKIGTCTDVNEKTSGREIIVLHNSLKWNCTSETFVLCFIFNFRMDCFFFFKFFFKQKFINGDEFSRRVFETVSNFFINLIFRFYIVILEIWKNWKFVSNDEDYRLRLKIFFHKRKRDNKLFSVK